MIRLIRVELTRLRWRRAVMLLLAACVVLPVFIAVGVSISKPSPETLEREFQSALAQSKGDLPACIEHPGRYGARTSANQERACKQVLYVPSREDFLYDTLDLDREREDGSGIAVAAVVGMLMMLVGATFAGHDWNTGSMSNQLLFETRRIRIWAAKAIAVTLVALVVSAVAITAFWGILAGFLSLRDFPPPRDGALLDGLQQGWRAAGIAATAALGGYSLTMLFRSTVFTIGVLLGVSVAGGLLLAAIGPNDPGPVDPTINLAAVLKDGSTYYVDVPDSCYSRGDFTGEDTTGPCAQNRTRSLSQGLGYLGVLVVVAGGASVISFQRRDVP